MATETSVQADVVTGQGTVSSIGAGQSGVAKSKANVSNFPRCNTSFDFTYSGSAPTIGRCYNFTGSDSSGWVLGSASSSCLSSC